MGACELREREDFWLRRVTNLLDLLEILATVPRRGRHVRVAHARIPVVVDRTLQRGRVHIEHAILHGGDILLLRTPQALEPDLVSPVVNAAADWNQGDPVHPRE